MNFGLADEDYATLDRLVIAPLKKLGFQLFIFGSRATGKHHQFSDIDLLVVPPTDYDRRGFAQIIENIEEARFPVKVDFVLRDEVAQSYADRIDREKIEL